MTATQDMIRGRSNIVTLTNNSGGALVAGDVCIQDTSADENVTTTTSAASTSKVLIAAESIGIAATGKFYESGYCPFVNVSASATRGYFLFTHTVAKQATSSTTYSSGAFGRVLKAGTSPSAILYSATAQLSSTGAGLVSTLMFTIDGGGSAISTGIKGDLVVDFGCTINSVTTLADQTGSIVVDIWKRDYANYPPTVTQTITASALPTLSSAIKAQDTTLTGWTTAITAGDVLRFNVNSAATLTRVLIALKVTRT